MQKAERNRVANTADKFAQSLCDFLNNLDGLIRLSPAKGYISAYDIFNLIDYRARNCTFVVTGNFDDKINEMIDAQIEFNKLWSGNETAKHIEKAVLAKDGLNQRKPIKYKNFDE